MRSKSLYPTSFSFVYCRLTWLDRNSDTRRYERDGMLKTLVDRAGFRSLVHDASVAQASSGSADRLAAVPAEIARESALSIQVLVRLIVRALAQTQPPRRGARELP